MIDPLEFIDKRMGFIKIISIEDPLPNQRTIYFKVKCDCGKNFSLSLGRVVANKYKSCGCKRNNSPRPSLRGAQINKREDLTGKRFGKLVAQKMDFTNKKSKWICLCDCGNIKSIKTYALTHGLTKTCNKCERYGENHFNWTGYKEISGKFFNKIKNNAKSRNLIFNITTKQIYEKFLQQKRKCALSNILLTFPTLSGASDGNASLDRIDNNEGYFLENVQWVEKNINFLKQDFNEKQLFEYCMFITNCQKEKTQNINSESIIDYMI